MRRSAVRFTVAIAACATTVVLSPQAWSDPVRAAGHGQLVRNPNGQLVSVVPGTETAEQHRAAQGPPPLATTTATTTGCASSSATLFYCHAGVLQSATSDGAYISTPVLSPQVKAGDNHSLAELAVESSDSRQIIEIGWRVYPGTTNDQTPRLFIFHWIDQIPTCYNTESNGCAFHQDTSTTITPGMALTPSSTPKQFGIEHYQGNWWFSYDNTWFGYIPDSAWGAGVFTQSGLIQTFGEVSSSTANPCTDMGKGVLPSDTTAAAVTGVGFYNSTSAVSLSKGTVEDPSHYDSKVTTANSFRYGGPGYC